MTLSARTSPWLPDSLGPVPWAARPALPARAASKSATSHSFRAEVRHCVLVSVVPGEVGGDLGSDFAARARACLAALSARWSATNRQNGWMYARMYAMLCAGLERGVDLHLGCRDLGQAAAGEIRREPGRASESGGERARERERVPPRPPTVAPTNGGLPPPRKKYI